MRSDADVKSWIAKKEYSHKWGNSKNQNNCQPTTKPDFSALTTKNDVVNY